MLSHLLFAATSKNCLAVLLLALLAQVSNSILCSGVRDFKKTTIRSGMIGLFGPISANFKARSSRNHEKRESIAFAFTFEEILAIICSVSYHTIYLFSCNNNLLIVLSSRKKTAAVAVSPRPTVIFGFFARREGIKDMISSPV